MVKRTEKLSFVLPEFVTALLYFIPREDNVFKK
jgi:hypothetical protein